MSTIEWGTATLKSVNGMSTVELRFLTWPRSPYPFVIEMTVRMDGFRSLNHTALGDVYSSLTAFINALKQIRHQGDGRAAFDCEGFSISISCSRSDASEFAVVDVSFTPMIPASMNWPSPRWTLRERMEWENRLFRVDASFLTNRMDDLGSFVEQLVALNDILGTSSPNFPL